MKLLWRNQMLSRGKRLWAVCRAMPLCLSLTLAGVLFSASEAVSRAITIAGNGPELHLVEQLTRAFEKSHLGAVVEIRWDPSFHSVKASGGSPG